VSSQVQRLASSMAIGRALFGGCLEEVESAELTKGFASCVATLARTRHTVHDIAACKVSMMNLVTKCPSVAHFKRSVKLTFLDTTIELEVADAMVEWQMQLLAHLKGKLLIHSREFPRLPYESWFLPDAKPLEGMQVRGSEKGGRHVFFGT